MGVAKIALGVEEKISLGNLNAVRDWGHAKDFVKALWLMLHQDEPEDLVIATGIVTRVRDFTMEAFRANGVEITWVGTNDLEKGYVESSLQSEYKLHVGLEEVNIDINYYRPTEVHKLVGDPSRAKIKLGWSPKYNLPGLVKEMVICDLRFVQNNPHFRSYKDS